MTSLKALERRIEADRAAIRANRQLLKQAVNRRVGSTAGLAGGLAVGFAGGWLFMARRKRRHEQALYRSSVEGRREVRAKESKLAMLRTVMMLTMPLWQKMLMPSAPPGADDST